MDRREFLAGSGALAMAAGEARAEDVQTRTAIPDEGWRLWPDANAAWQDDALFLPDEAPLEARPVNPPTGGWEQLTPGAGIAVTLPATVEQYYWGRFGSRPYTFDEYAWALRDPVPQNGAYRGVSWWWRGLEIPASCSGRRILLEVRGARLRAEVYLNHRLVGYSILEELPFTCDLTAAANPGGENLLAIRITNPGGRYDWLDGAPMTWGAIKLQRSHGFGGLDRGLVLHAEPMDAHIADLWVLNTPAPRSVHAFVRIEGAPATPPVLSVVEGGGPVPARIVLAGRDGDVFKFTVTAAAAKLWSLAQPNLYRLVARHASPGGESERSVSFGFRWFAPDGLGRDAKFRLNGRRIRLYSAISWGYWGLNGLWPTPELAEKEVRQAKALGLNCLSFHRNVGKEEVLDSQDRLGLLRVMEPGGGKFALGALPDGTKLDAPSVVMTAPTTDADRFAQRYMLAKCAAMARAFRSHPSLVQYTLQNETGADFSNPATMAALEAIHAEDQSRCILLNDGFVAAASDPAQAYYHNAAQAWFAPYESAPHRSDKEAWGGWWSEHQGAGEQWHDGFYKGPRDFNYDEALRPVLVQYGEMEACASPDNHGLAIAAIIKSGGHAYDLEDHQQAGAAYDAFLDRWGFRGAFPDSDTLYRAIGRCSYESWQQYLENVRINDCIDAAAISGWESTAIENHAGLVDNLRNFKSDPAIIRASLLPVRPLAKQHSLVVAQGERALFDLYLLNDTGAAVKGEMVFAMTDPDGRRQVIARPAAPALARDRFSVLAQEGVASPPLTQEGMYRFTLSLTGFPGATHTRDIFVCGAGAPPILGRTIEVGVFGAQQSLLDQLSVVPGIRTMPYTPDAVCAAIIVSGPAGKPAELPAPLIESVRAGTPLLVMAQDDTLADSLTTQLAAAGAFSYRGQVGRMRAPWMGSWYFVRAHPAYDGLPVDRAMGVYHQVDGRQANGLLVDGPGVEVCAGYGRDHDRQIGAGTFIARLGSGKLLFQRVPDLNEPMQQRFLRNAIAWLCAN